MTRQKFLPLLFACVLGFFAQAASSSTFYLTESNTWADGINYAQVDVAESGGNLDFTVTALYPIGYKFSDFYFNLDRRITGDIVLTGLPSWNVKADQNVSAFGWFSDGEQGKGNSLLDKFSFTADSKLFDLTLSSLVTNDDGWIFAAHMQCQNKPAGTCEGILGITSHQVAGPGVGVVPLPAAAWLFGSALLGFVSFTSRRKA